MSADLREKQLPDTITVGAFRAVRPTGELSRDGTTERLEPKVMDLLFLLATRPGEAFTKDEIMEAVWPNVTVGDDTLAKAVSRLRKALDDDAKEPAYIETLPKRGYRLIAGVAPGGSAVPPDAAPAVHPPRRFRAIAAAIVAALVLGALTVWFRPDQPRIQSYENKNLLVERANDYYFQYKRADNEAAIALFERILAERPDHAPALSGLANALVQKVIRWPDEPGAPEYTKLADALASGRTKTPAAHELLARARTLAERAVKIAPDDAGAQKALGFVQAASGELQTAVATYEHAVALDPDAWGPLINIGDTLEISNRKAEALPYFERAYAAMTRVYDKEAARVRPWYAELGVLIGDRHKEWGRAAEAESWYRRVLVYAPLHRTATEHLAALLRQQGDVTSADQLCANFSRRTGDPCGK